MKNIDTIQARFYDQVKNNKKCHIFFYIIIIYIARNMCK